jgi:hypothetical protein
MKIKFGELALLFAFGILLSAAWSNIAVYAQNKTASSSSPNPAQQHIAKIKITSPIRDQQLPVGKDLTVSGTSIDNATSNDCKVSVIVNKVRPYQNTTAAGAGGAADYSKWNFVLTSKYTTIKPGENRITAKYECASNPDANSFSSVNITGVQAGTSNSNVTTGGATTKAADTATVTKPSVITTPQAQTTKASGTAAKEQRQQHPVTVNNNNPASSVSNNAEAQRMAPVSSVNNKPLSSTPTSTIAPQVKAINQKPQQQPPQMVTVSNNTDGQNSRLASPSPMITSDKMMYLGYPASATTNKYLTEKNAVGPKSTARVSNTDTTTDNSSTNKGNIDIKYRPHDITSNNHNDVSTSQVNTKRNTANANNNFIFPFSYP